MNPLIPNYGKNLLENPDIKLQQEEERQEDIVKNKNAEGNTPAMQEGLRDIYNTTEFNKEDTDRKLQEAEFLEKLETQLDNGEITQEEYDELIINLSRNDENINENQHQHVNESKEKENKQILEKFKDNPSFPVLERFMNIEVSEGVKMDLLTEADLLKLSQHLETSEDHINSLREGIKSIDFDDDRTQTVLDNYLYTVDNINDEVKVDGEGQYNLPEDFKGDIFPVLSENLDNDVVQLIIKNYTKFPDGEDGNTNVEKDIFTSCEVTLNKIIENKNFPKNKTFEKAVHDIRNGDIDTRVEALQYINSLVNTQEGLKGGKSKSSFNKIKSEHNLTKKLYMEFKINQLEEQISLTKDISDKIKLQKEIENLLDSISNEDHFEGEIISGGKVDIQGEGSDNIGENT